MRIQLDYAITRPFRWSWFTPLALLGAVLSIGFLSAVNVALTGYETITAFNEDFNVTQLFWHDKFMPFRAKKPGTLCDSHVFNVGELFTTNYTMFQWSVEAISKGNLGNSAMSYNGTTLDYCDITALFVNGDLRTWTIDLTPVVTCRSPTGDLEVDLQAKLSITYLQGKHVASFGMIQFGWFEARRITDFTTHDPKILVGAVLGQLAAEDAARRIYTASLASNGTTPVTISFQADFSEYCPASLGPSAPCMTSVPQFNISYAAAVFPNMAVQQYVASQPIGPANPQLFTDDSFLPISNLIHIAHALVRIDLGNGSPNNFVLHPERTNDTIASSFPVTPYNPPLMSYSAMYDYWNKPNENVRQVLPLQMGGPATIRMVYLCRFLRMKSPGQLFISVLVATLSMFSSGWAVFMVVATYFARRDNAHANICRAHVQPEKTDALMRDDDIFSEGYVGYGNNRVY